MSPFRLRTWLAAAVCPVVLAACTGPSIFGSSMTPEATANTTPTIRSQDLVGRWGYAVYYNEADRTRIEASARAQCSRPANISLGPTGGVMMPIANHSQPQQEQSIKAANGKNYIGPPGEAGGQQDLEIVSFDGKVLVTRTVDTDETGHLNSVYVRCRSKGEARG
jgi:hypothetical protein